MVGCLRHTDKLKQPPHGKKTKSKSVLRGSRLNSRLVSLPDPVLARRSKKAAKKAKARQGTRRVQGSSIIPPSELPVPSSRSSFVPVAPSVEAISPAPMESNVAPSASTAQAILAALPPIGTFARAGALNAFHANLPPVVPVASRPQEYMPPQPSVFSSASVDDARGSMRHLRMYLGGLCDWAAQNAPSAAAAARCINRCFQDLFPGSFDATTIVSVIKDSCASLIVRKKVTEQVHSDPTNRPPAGVLVNIFMEICEEFMGQARREREVLEQLHSTAFPLPEVRNARFTRRRVAAHSTPSLSQGSVLPGASLFTAFTRADSSAAQPSSVSLRRVGISSVPSAHSAATEAPSESSQPEVVNTSDEAMI